MLAALMPGIALSKSWNKTHPLFDPKKTYSVLIEYTHLNTPYPPFSIVIEAWEKLALAVPKTHLGEKGMVKETILPPGQRDKSDPIGKLGYYSLVWGR